MNRVRSYKQLVMGNSTCWFTVKQVLTELYEVRGHSCVFPLYFRQILLIGGSNPAEDVEKFKDKGYVMIRGPLHQHRHNSQPF